MSAAPNNRARLTRYNVGSQSRQLESVVGARSRGRFSMAEETSMAQVLLLLREWRRLALDFYSMKMELGEHPRQFFLRVDRLVKEMERVGRPTLEKDIDIVLLTGLSSQYDAEVRMLESSAEWPLNNGCWSRWRQRRRWPIRPQPLRRQRHQRRGRQQ